MRLLVEIMYLHHQQERIIAPVPRKSAVSSLNHYHPVALTPILMKKDNLTSSLDPHSMPTDPTDPLMVPYALPYTDRLHRLYRFLLCYNAVVTLWKGLATKNT